MDKLRIISRLDATFKPTAFFILLILSALLLPALKHWLESSAFLVKEVEIYPESYGYLENPDWINEPLYSLDLHHIRNQIQSYPNVGEVELQRVPPETLRIDIAPAEPVAILDAGKKYLVDAQGKIIRPALNEDAYPIIKMDAKNDWDLAKISEVLTPILDLPICASPPSKLCFAYGHLLLESKKKMLQIDVDGIKIDLGGPPYDKKWNQLSKVVPYIKDHKQKVSYIFVGDDPNHVVIRP